jgi:hypothetical protein
MKLSPKILANITLLVYWGPSNPLYYLWGFILFFFILFFKPEWVKTNGVFSRRIIGYVVLFIALFFISFFYNYSAQKSSINNLIWSILTYGSSLFILLALLMIPFKESDLKGIVMFSLYLSIFQVFLGYFQMLQFQHFQHINPFSGEHGQTTGDYFVGTTFNPGIGSFVAVKMSLTAILFMPFWFAKKNLKNSIIVLLLFIGWVLASAIFTLIFGLIVIVWFFIVKKIMHSFTTFKLNKSVFYTVLIAIGAALIFAITQPDNISYIIASAEETYASITDKDVILPTLKVIYYKKTFGELPKEYPMVNLIGVGPGNYSSRSAWLTSGEYLLEQPSYIPITPTPVAQKYTFSLWSKKLISADFPGAGSIIHQPFSTWVSVYAEMGIPALIIFFLIFRSFYSGFTMAQKTASGAFMQEYTLGIKMSLVYLGLLFFIENLFEYPLVMGQFFVFACAVIRVYENKMNPTSIKQN